MHFVAALDDVPEMRAVLTLFEGVATGAADGYARVAGRPAATLLHLGPGLGNGIANLHNARRARSPVVNVVGDHATYHKHLDPPLESDIVSLAGTVSGWVRGRRRGRPPWPPRRPRPWRPPTARRGAWPPWWCRPSLVVRVPAEALPRPSPSGARRRWPGTSSSRRPPRSVRAGRPPSSSAARLCAGGAWRRPARVAAATGARLLGESFPANLERGAGLPAPERLSYLAEFVEGQLAGARHLVVAGTGPPVSFFAYPGRPGDLVPEGCEVHRLGGPGDDVPAALEHLAEALGAAPGAAVTAPAARPDKPSGPLTLQTLAEAVGALLPEDAVVVDEANTAGHLRPGGHGRGPAPRLAHPHRGGHRLRPAGGHRGRRGGCRPTGAVPPGRRERHVHGPGPVDPGPRGARRDHGGAGQPRLRHPAPRALEGGRRGRRAQGGRGCSTSPDPTSTSSRWPPGSGCRRPGPRPPRS